jgi:hypothetical protein
MITLSQTGPVIITNTSNEISNSMPLVQQHPRYEVIFWKALENQPDMYK